MVNYACAFSQSESGKYFEWIINGSYKILRLPSTNFKGAWCALDWLLFCLTQIMTWLNICPFKREKVIATNDFIRTLTCTCNCLVPRSHYSARPKPFGSRGPCENVKRVSPKRIDWEGLEKRRTGTRQHLQIKLKLIFTCLYLNALISIPLPSALAFVSTSKRRRQPNDVVEVKQTF